MAEVRKHRLYEADNPKGVDPEQWKSVVGGLHGAFGSVDVKYNQNEVPAVDGGKSWSGVAWRGERVYAQIVLWTSDGVEQVRFSASNLVDGKGRTISASNVKPQFVRYVLGDGKLMPDVLDTAERIDMDSNSVRPIWVSVDVPAKAKAGKYSGKVIVDAAGGVSLDFAINVEVLGMTLPASSKWSFHLDLWQNPWSVARYHNVEPWSKEHWQLLRPLLVMLADAGQKCITTSIVDKPWGGQTYDSFGSLIDWRLRRDGSWAFDYTLFDDYVKFCDECGISEQINCYSMVPWSNLFRYYDEASGDYVTIKATPGTKAYENHWRPFLKDFVKHLKKKGWLDRCTIAMDERSLEDMQKVIGFINETAPGLKISLAGTYHSEIKFDTYDLSIGIERSPTNAQIAERVGLGLPTTFYICCGPARPNTFPHSPSAESAWLGWFAAGKGYSGFLRWAYNSWVEDPLYDTSHVTWAAGDCFMVYPGPRSSIRFERLREGIADFEKIRIVREVLGKSGKAADKRGLLRLDKMLESFSYPQEKPYAESLNAGKALLVELSRLAAD